MAKNNPLAEQRNIDFWKKVYAVASLVVIIIVVGYGYFSWKTLSEYKEGINTNKALIADVEAQLREQEDQYLSDKESFEDLYQMVDRKVAAVFPLEDQYTELTRQMDAFEEELTSKTNPFEISNINYQNPYENDNYAVLPLRMSIRSSADNFKKFLHLVENSGSLSDEIRLMDISSIKLNFSENENEKEMINFSVNINAYFQKLNG